MTVPTNTTQTFTQTNIREDLENMIYNVDPYKTPLLNMAKRAKAEQTYHEWNIDILAAQNTSNAQIQGDDATADAQNPTGRIGNYTQISRKVVSLTGTLQAVRAAGGSNKMGYQLLRNSKALKRDMEGILTKNAAKSAGNSSTAAITGGLPAWLTTNTVYQTGGSPSGANPTGVVTVGTQNFGNGTTTRTYNSATTLLTETMFNNMAQLQYKNSGDVGEYALVSAANKQNISKFTGVAGTRFNRVEDKRLRNAIDLYETDFGEIKLVPDIFMAQSGDVYSVEPDYIKVAYLRPFQTVPLAKTGDSDKKMLIVEYSLEVCNEHAIGAIFDTNG